MVKQKFLDIKSFASSVWKTTTLAFSIAPTPTSIYVLLSFISMLGPVAANFFNGKLIDSLLKAQSSGGDFSKIIQILLFFGAIFLVFGILNWIQRYNDFVKFTEISKEMSKIVASKYSDLEEKHFDNPKTQTLIRKVMDSSEWKPTNVFEQSVHFFAYIFQVAFVAALLASQSVIYLIPPLLATVPALLLNIFYGKVNWQLWDTKGDLKKHYWESKWYLNEHDTLPEVRIFGLKEYLLNRAFRYYKQFQDEQIAVEKKRAVVGMGLEILSTGLSLLGVGLLVLSVINKNFSIGTFSFLLLNMTLFRNSVSTLFSTISRLYEDSLYMGDFFKFLELEGFNNGSVVLTSEHNGRPPLIEIKNLSFKYPQGKSYALRDISLTINPGENIAIVGENGAGKTTLIKLLVKFYGYDEGSIKINGIELNEIDKNSWYKYLGTLFQEFNRYYFEVKDNIGVGNIQNMNDLEKIIEASKEAGADDFVSEYKDGYNQILSTYFEGGIKPSIGQWQRLALARAFFRDSPILILDEPTSAIDPKGEYEIFQRLFQFAKDKTVIIISHRFSTVRNASRILVMETGRVVEDGTHEELLKIENGIYKSAFEIQRKGYI